jgi:SMC interacting uncharacterized protein involved in chromosome segregation
MNTIKSVYNKLFKEETQLASHEVELSSVEDLKKFVASAIAEQKKFADLQKKYDALNKQKENLIISVQGVEKEVRDTLNKGTKTYQDFLAKAKELGIEASAINNADVKDAKMYGDILENLKKDLDSMKKKLGYSGI